MRLSTSAGGSRVSISRVLSYVVDWIIIILFAIVGALFNLAHPFHRAFSLADPSISFPMRPDTVKVGVLVIVALVAPAVIIAAICLLLVPGPTTPRGTPASVRWKRKLWELNTSWMGLAMSCAITFFITQGMKNLFGRPRPDFLSRCNADLDAIAAHIIGGYGPRVPQGQYLVDYKICQQSDDSILDDGFMSFPSGHASFSWAGLLYLTFFVCAKFAIAIPWTLPSSSEHSAFPAPIVKSDDANRNAQHSQSLQSLRGSAAAPPVYGLVLALIPIGAAIYVVSSRFTDYRHHPFDLIVGSLIGIIMS